MATKFLSPEAQYRAGVNMREEPTGVVEAPSPTAASGFSRTEAAPKATTAAVSVEPPAKTKTEFSHAAIRNQEDAPPCSTCGSIMIRSGSCYKCANCGTTSGCA
jgi:ribonucleoside-diphosphate reductase alpha chain